MPHVSFDFDDLEPVISATVRATIAELRESGMLADRAHDPLLCEAEVARLLRVRPFTVRDERLRGRLAGVRVGRRVHYDRTEVDRYLQARRTAGEAR